MRDLRRAHAPFHAPPSLAVTGKALRSVDAKDRAPNDFPNEYLSDAARAENVARRDAKASFLFFFVSTPPSLFFASAASTAQPYATPAEALQSQTALQEKLKRVRNTFADIRRQVGYTDD